MRSVRLQRKAKDFARADEIRDELLEKGIILKDTREGVQWKKSVDWQFDSYMQEIFQDEKGGYQRIFTSCLTYIGDCIFDLVIKSLVMNEGNKQVQKMHKETSSYVQASAQSK